MGRGQYSLLEESASCCQLLLKHLTTVPTVRKALPDKHLMPSYPGLQCVLLYCSNPRADWTALLTWCQGLPPKMRDVDNMLQAACLAEAAARLRNGSSKPGGYARLGGIRVLSIGLSLAIELARCTAQLLVIHLGAGMQAQHPLALYEAVVHDPSLLVQHPNRIPGTHAHAQAMLSAP